jgi:hypothetical protein
MFRVAFLLSVLVSLMASVATAEDLSDEHVSNERAQARAAAACEPKTVRTFSSDHELNIDAAKHDRPARLQEQLKLK